MTLIDTGFGLTEAERSAIAEEDFAGPGRTYPIDTQEHLDAAARLIGMAPKGEQAEIRRKAIEIARRKRLKLPKSWEDAAFAFELTTQNSATEEYVPWRHKIFEAGDYPAQGVRADEGYLDRLVANFKPAKLKNSHTHDPQSIFSTVDLGSCDRIWRQGGELFGEGRVHQVVRMISDRPSASIEIENKDADPRLTAIALLNWPQVPDAAIAALFAAFASKRHLAVDGGDHATTPARGSQNGQAGMQAMHDLAVKPGADCPGYADAARMGALLRHDPARGDRPTAKENAMNPSIWDKVKAFFRGMRPEDLAQTGLTPEEVQSLDTAKFEPPAKDLDPAVSDELKRLRQASEANDARFSAMAEAQLNQRAAQFAADWKLKRKITPAEEAHVAGLYVMAAKADGDGKTAQFGADGAVVEGTHVKALGDSMEARRTLAIFETEIPNEKPTGVNGDRVAIAHRTLAGAVDSYNARGSRS